MPAIHLGIVGQRGELGERREHLFRGAFEQATAAAGEKRIATEQCACPIIGNVRARVAGDVEHREAHAEFWNADAVALRNRLGEHGNRLVARPEHRHAVFLHQLGDAADVIGVMVGGKDRGELEVFARQIVEHGPRLAGIDHRGVGRVAQRPDIIVFKRLDGHDIHASILRAKRGAKV